MPNSTKRLFFGLEALSPWPVNLPKGRMLQENERHATLAFLGNVEWNSLSERLEAIPLPSFHGGLGAVFDKILFLPHRHPHVVCWHANFFGALSKVEHYQNELSNWLHEQGFLPLWHQEKWLPHVTLARHPFDLQAWKEAFSPLPVIFKTLHLYESLGNLHYRPLWSRPLPLPFEEIEHTADIAFIIKGETLSQIYLHALLALAFKFPELLTYEQIAPEPASLDDIIILLNGIVADADQAIGCPFKAVSLHGELEERQNYLQWEMIVDV